MNIRCSNRCANPVRPGTSSFDPTWYHKSTATRGLDRSTCRMTVRPFASTNVSKSIFNVVKEGPARMVAGAPPPRTKIGVGVALTLGALGAVGVILLAPGRARADGGIPQATGILLPVDRPAEV